MVRLQKKGSIWLHLGHFSVTVSPTDIELVYGTCTQEPGPVLEDSTWKPRDLFTTAISLSRLYNNGEVMVYHPLMSKCANETLHGRPQTPAA